MNGPQDSNVNFPTNLSGIQTDPMLAALYEKSYAKMTAVAAGVLGRQEGAEDIVQQAASIILTQREEFDSEASLLAWMVGVVRNCARNEKRKYARRRTWPTDPGHLESVENTTDSRELLAVDPSSGQLAADQDCFADQLSRALKELAEEARCCLLLRTVHELSYAEIAEILEIPQGTAMSHVHRSRLLLRKKLNQVDPQT